MGHTRLIFNIFFFLLLVPCGMLRADKLLEHLEDPHVCAFLDLIAHAEGTLGEDEYRIMYGMHICDSFKDHPRQVICAELKGRMWCSSAAGKYQIVQKTWDSLRKMMKLNDFSPINQDRAALRLIRDAGALNLIKDDKLEEALYKVRKIWASLPGAPYNQPTKKVSELKEVYRRLLRQHKRRLLRVKKGRLNQQRSLRKCKRG